MVWGLLIDRGDLTHTELVDAAPLDPSYGQVVLKVDRVGMTANNVTYAVFGDAMKYWDFFPAGEREGVAYGRVPLWGFAEVERSTVAGVEEGTRYFGYLPTSRDLVVEPTRVGPKGFRDASPHRAHLPSPYNGLTTTTGDVPYDADLEDPVHPGLVPRLTDIDRPSNLRVSDDGNVVGLRQGGNFVITDANGAAPRVVSADNLGHPVSSLFGNVDLSGDGKWIAFGSSEPNLVEKDTNGVSDVFLRATGFELVPPS